NSVLGKALLDLARLLVGVDVEREIVLAGVPTELLEPVAWARANGVGGDADADTGVAQLLEPAQILGDRRLTEAVDAAAGIGDVEEDELDTSLRGRLRGSLRLGEPEVVELADGRVARVAKLRVDRDVVGTNPFGGLSPRELEHRLAPGPEV